MIQILTLSLSGTLLGLLLMLFRRICRNRLPSTLFYGAWLLVLLRLLLPLPGVLPALRNAGNTGNIQSTATAVSDEQPTLDYARGQTADVSGINIGDNGEQSALIGDGREVSVMEASPDAASADSAAVQETSGDRVIDRAGDLLTAAIRSLDKDGIWLWIWLAGALLALALKVASYVRFQKALKPTLQEADEGIAEVFRGFKQKRKPLLTCSRAVQTPMLVGLFHPAIVLPDSPMDDEMAANVLRHELMHYRRGDLLWKWASVAAFSIHWFNPLMSLFRREMDRVCELSCDECVLRHLDRAEAMGYGETLLDLAASHALPAGVVATTLGSEKRDLKERLEQIMKYKMQSRRMLAMSLALLLGFGICAAALAPQQSLAASENETQQETDDESEVQIPEGVTEETENTEITENIENTENTGTDVRQVTVSTVDEFLAAIAPDTTIFLTAGEYDLSDASDYGENLENGRYTWREAGDGDELVISGVTGLSVIFEGNPEEAVIMAEPRYANVLTFEDCEDITLRGFTAGHTEEPGQCVGGVLKFDGNDDVNVRDCVLYGCGVMGITAENSSDITVTDTEIRECSNGAVSFTACRGILMNGCDIHSCGEETIASRVIEFKNCYGAVIAGSDIYENYSAQFLTSRFSEAVTLIGCRVRDNIISTSMFAVYQYPVTIEGSSFENNSYGYLYSDAEDVGMLDQFAASAVDASGDSLNAQSLEEMTCEEYSAERIADLMEDIQKVIREQVAAEGDTAKAEETAKTTVSTVDELLAAIAPDTQIELKPGEYDLSDAAHYGSLGGAYYYWAYGEDGPGLVITGVSNLTITGAGREGTSLLSVPRMKDVICFENCTDTAIAGMELGHIVSETACMGDVVSIRSCESISIRECGLFGCGRVGVTANSSSDITVADTEIYDCSGMAFDLFDCQGVSFENCDIHDCGENGDDYDISDSSDVSINE